ncbi:hypothetical protein ACFLWM_02135 [Chloroflexota bacterium]
MINNLELIKDNGINQLIKIDKKKWECPRCGGEICCHNGLCFNCELEKVKDKKHKYSWDEN